MTTIFYSPSSSFVCGDYKNVRAALCGTYSKSTAKVRENNSLCVVTLYRNGIKTGVVKAYGASKAETIKQIEYWKRRCRFSGKVV